MIITGTVTLPDGRIEKVRLDLRSRKSRKRSRAKFRRILAAQNNQQETIS